MEFDEIFRDMFKAIDERFDDIENLVSDLNDRVERKMRASEFDFRAVALIGLGLFLVSLLIGLSFNTKIGNTDIAYENSGIIQVTLACLSAGSAGFAFFQHKLGKK